MFVAGLLLCSISAQGAQMQSRTHLIHVHMHLNIIFAQTIVIISYTEIQSPNRIYWNLDPSVPYLRYMCVQKLGIRRYTYLETPQAQAHTHTPHISIYIYTYTYTYTYTYSSSFPMCMGTASLNIWRSFRSMKLKKPQQNLQELLMGLLN